MDTASNVTAIGGTRAWKIWAAAASVYLVAMLHRTSLSVAGLAAADRFEIGAAQLSTFTVLQLLVYAAMQLPVGLLLDRYGSRRLLAAGIALMTLGQLGFAVVHAYPLALASRALVGLGDATVFLSVLRLAAVWFPPSRNPLLTQLTSLTGQIGALATAIPMAHALARYGWEATYLGAASVGILAGVVMWVMVSDHPEAKQDTAPVAHLPLRASLRECWRDHSTRFGVWAYFASMFLPNMLVLLWGYPWLVEGEGLPPTNAAFLLSLLTAAAMASGPLVGWIVGHRPQLRAPLLHGLLSTSMVFWTAAWIWPGTPPTALLAAVMLSAGTGFSGALLAFDFARNASPPERVGTALALVNLGGFASTIPAILAIGLVLDWLSPGGVGSGARGHAFHIAMGVPYLLWAIGLVQMRRTARASTAPADMA